MSASFFGIEKHSPSGTAWANAACFLSSRFSFGFFYRAILLPLGSWTSSVGVHLLRKGFPVLNFALIFGAAFRLFSPDFLGSLPIKFLPEPTTPPTSGKTAREISSRRGQPSVGGAVRLLFLFRSFRSLLLPSRWAKNDPPPPRSTRRWRRRTSSPCRLAPLSSLPVSLYFFFCPFPRAPRSWRGSPMVGVPMLK